MIGSPGNDESASTKESRPIRVNQSNSSNSVNHDHRSDDEDDNERRRGQGDSTLLPLLLQPPSSSSSSSSPAPPPAPSTIQATSSHHEQGQSIESISPPPPPGTRSRSMSLVPGLDFLSPLLFSGSSSGQPPPASALGRKNSSIFERTPQFMTISSSFTTRNGPWSQDPLSRARNSIDVRSFPSYLARKRQSIIGARLFDTLVEVAGSPLKSITPEGNEDNEETRSSTDNNSHKNGDSRGSRKSLVHRLRGNRKSIEEEEPEAPTLSLGERVAWLKTKGPEFGTVRWIGRLPKVSASWTVGVEFDNAIGSTDGKFESRRYFTAKDSFAKFLPLSSLTRVENIVERQRSGTLLSRMSVQLKPGQLISVQREPENNLPIHCALNAPHHIDHDVHVPNMNHCLCNNCNHPCAHLCKTKKPKGRKTDMAHMCHFSQKPHNKLCCGGEELLYSLASAQDLESNGSTGGGGIGTCSGTRRGRMGSNMSGGGGGDSTSGNGHGPVPNGCSISSNRRRSGRSDGSRRRSSGSSSTIRKLRDKSRRISSAPTSTERKAESQTTTKDENGGGGGSGECTGGGGGNEKEREEEIIIGGGEGTSCQEGVTLLNPNPFALSKLKSGSQLSVSDLPSTGASQVEVYIARGALTDESDLDDDDDRYQDDEEDEDEYDDDGCSSGLVSSQGRRYLRGKRGLLSHQQQQQSHSHLLNQQNRRRRHHRRHSHYNRRSGGSRSITTNTGRSSRSSRRRYSSDGGGTQITSGTGDGCSGPSRRSGKRSGLRSLVSCLVPSIPTSYKSKSGKSSKSKKKSKGKNSSTKGSSSSRRRHDDDDELNDHHHHHQQPPFHHLGQANCDPINYPYYTCSCDGRSSSFTPHHHNTHHLNESLGELSSTGRPLVYSGQESNQPYLHHHYHPLLPPPPLPSSSLQKQQHTSTDHRYHYYPHPPPPPLNHHHHQHQQSLAHTNSTRHSSTSSHHPHHPHLHQPTATYSSSSSRCQPQSQQQQQQQQNRHHHSQRKHHGLSTSPEPEPSPINVNKTLTGRSSTLQPHPPPPLPSTTSTLTIEDNLNFGVGVGLTGRASPCGHFYYSPCPISASQLSIGALQKHLSSTNITPNNNLHHHHHHHPQKQQPDTSANIKQPSSPNFEKSVNHNQSNQKFPQLKSTSSSSTSQQHQQQLNQCTKLVDLDENLLNTDLKSVQSTLNKVNHDEESNFILDLTTFNLNCDLISNQTNKPIDSNCLLTSPTITPSTTTTITPPATIKTSAVNNYQSALINNKSKVNSFKQSNCSSNEINQISNVKSNLDEMIEINGKLNHSQFNDSNHNLIYNSNKLTGISVGSGRGSPGGITSGRNGGGGGGGGQLGGNQVNNINQHSRHHESKPPPFQPKPPPPPSSTNTTSIVTPTPNGIINGENVLINEPNCSYINYNNSSTMNRIKMEVELTRSPSIQSYTSNSMISPRRKRKGPAPPPPVIGQPNDTFKPFPGHSGINVSPLSSPSSSSSVTPTQSPSHLPGPSSTVNLSDGVTPPPPQSQPPSSSSSTSTSLITSKSSNVVNLINPGPSTSGCSKNTLTMGRKKSIKNKPAPSPPPPLPTLPPLASRPKSITSKGASPKPNNTIGANPSSSSSSSSTVVIIHESSSSSPQKPLSSPTLSPSNTGHCPSPQIVPNSCKNLISSSPLSTSNTPVNHPHHLNYRPVTIKCLPCRSYSVPVCPISTLTRSLSDKKQINGKQMLKSIASYSSDLNLPKLNHFNGLINNSPTEATFQHEQTLESDSIIITYDDPDYIYPINFGYSSCEIPYTNTNHGEIVYTEDDDNDDKMNSKHVSMPITPRRRKRNQKKEEDKLMMNKSQSFTVLSSAKEQGSPLGRPPRPPPPNSSGYKIVNKSIPQIPIRAKRQNRLLSLTNYCSLDSCCRPDHFSNYKIVPTLPSKASSLVLMRPRSAPSSPSHHHHHLDGSCSLLRTDSTLTFNQDKTSESESFSINNQGTSGVTCSTTCSLCSLGGGTIDRTPSASTVTTARPSTIENESVEMLKQKVDETINMKEDDTIEEPIYEEIDFGLISENVAALLSPRQLINSAKSRTWSDKSSMAKDDDEMIMTACNNAINIIPIETMRGGRRLSNGTGGGGIKGKEGGDEMVIVSGHHTNSGGEILSDTSDDRVTVKSMTTHNNNQLKPWAYSSSSLDSEQSTTSSGSTVKQWANQIVSYASNNHYHPHSHHPHHPHHHHHHCTNHPLHHSHHHHHHHHPHHYPPHHGSSGSPSSGATSSCYHGNHSTFYQIQGIGHDDDDYEDNQQHQRQPNHHPLDPYHPHLPASSSLSPTPGQQQHQQHCHHHHCPHHHYLHPPLHSQNYRHYHHHHGHRMITTSTSDHSLSSLSSSNFSEDPATPTPPNLMTTAFHDDYNFTFLPDDLSLSAGGGHYYPDLDETNEEEEDVTVDEEDVEEEEVMIFDEILLQGDAKNEFGKSSCSCYSDPFLQIPDCGGDDEKENDDDDEDDDEDEDGENGGGGKKMKEKETERDGGKSNDEKSKSLVTTPTLPTEVFSPKIKSPINCSTKLNDVKLSSPSPSSSCPSPLPPSSTTPTPINTNTIKTRSLSSLNYHQHRINCDQIATTTTATNQSPCHCHQCYRHNLPPYHHHHHHQHLPTNNQNNYQQQPIKTINQKSGHLGCKDNMASSWDGSGPFTGDHHHHNQQQQQQSTQNHNHNENTNNNDGNNNINRLMQELQLAISYGQHRKAALLARQLALRKVSCSFNQSTVNSTSALDDQPIIVYLYIEDKQSRQGPFPIQLLPSMTVAMLKQKIEGDFGFPVNLQSWILGKCLATNEDALLSTYGVTLSGCPIFLYLLSNSNNAAAAAAATDQVTINEKKNTLGQSVSTPVLGEKSQHDRNEVKNEISGNGNDGDQNDQNGQNGHHHDKGNTTFLTNDTKEEMKGGKRRSISIAAKLSSSSSSIGENINETHADHHHHHHDKDNERSDLVGGKSSSGASGSGSADGSGGGGGNCSKGPQPSESMDSTTLISKTIKRGKVIKVTPSPSTTSTPPTPATISTIDSPSTSKSHPKVTHEVTHGENRNHHYPPSLNQVNDQLIRKADKLPIESPRRKNRTIQSTLKHNDIKMMQTLDNQASSSGANKPDNDNKVNYMIMIQQQSNDSNLIKNQRYPGDNHGGNDNNKSSGNVDTSSDNDDDDDNNKGNGNKMAEEIGQQVKGDGHHDDDDNEDNKGDDQLVIESKGVITETYKQLMALDDVDLVKNFEDFECPICFNNIPSGTGVVLRDCLHTFCRECLSNAIEFCDEAIVKCPYRSDEYYCDSTITDREIKSLASNELYQKYLARSMKAAELRIPKSFHCKTADCPGWCEYDDNVNTFPCPVCTKVNCLTCQAIHEEINCRQYQDALEFEAAESNEDAKKTKQFLDNMLDKGEALRCPICFVILIKKWGCDWVKCSMCQSEICWVTKGPRWGPGGKGDISGGCKCMINGQKCHPKCNYCH